MRASGVFELTGDRVRAERLPRGVRHFLYLPAAAGAEAVAGVLEREGWETRVREDGNVWLVVAACLRVLSKEMVHDTHARLEALALAHNGQYDGWETQAPV